MTKESIAVIGGGIAGLLAASLLEEKYKVTLLDRSPVPGGLLRSMRDKDGQVFDFGCHILGETGERNLDDHLFSSLADSADWRTFDEVAAGTYFNRVLGRDSTFINAREVLDEAVYKKGIYELLHTIDLDRDAKNLRELSEQKFGRTFTCMILEKLIRKQFNCDLEDLAADNPFFMKRLICFTAQVTREMKRSPYFDSKLAFHGRNAATSKCRHFYPKKGGVGSFVDMMWEKLSRGSSVLRMGTTINKITRTNNGWVIDANDDRVRVNRILWTLPLPPLLKLLGISAEPITPRVNILKLVNLAYDRPPLVDNHFITCYESDMRTFRVTLYSNLQGECGANNRLTVESILSPTDQVSPEDLIAAVSRELIDMGIVGEESRQVSSQLVDLEAHFPVLTTDMLDWLRRYSNMVEAECSGIMLSNKARGKAFFMNEVLRDAFDRVNKLCS